jgi:integrase
MCDALSRNAPKLAAGVEILLANCLEERMSQRLSTRLACDSRFNNHILPKWGDKEITDLQARVVELWLMSLALAPKTRVHVRGLLHQLWDYAMFRQDVPLERNPMELVTIKGATKRIRQPRSLTVEEFQKFVAELGEPVRTIAPGVRLLRTED